jgi:hypothetical protein
MNKIRVTVTIDQDVIKGIKELSENEQRSVSQQVNKILKEYLNSAENN